MPAVPDMRLASARDNLSFYPSRLIAILVLKPDVMDKTILRIRQFSRFLTYPEQEVEPIGTGGESLNRVDQEIPPIDQISRRFRRI